ncbi:MAG: 50S ribosomal protein L7ae [Lachnospiraceae bacterium]|nr:50S ribosomal protein L7ae [Lachnospiraceae bacterium]
MLGLAAKGRNVLSGEFSTEKAVKTGNANLVIIAVDASDNTKKSFCNMCAFYKVQFYEYGTKEELGHCIGKRYRASLAITDVGLAKAVEEKIKSSKTIE